MIGGKRNLRRFVLLHTARPENVAIRVAWNGGDVPNCIEEHNADVKIDVIHNGNELKKPIIELQIMVRSHAAPIEAPQLTKT